MLVWCLCLSLFLTLVICLCLFLMTRLCINLFAIGESIHVQCVTLQLTKWQLQPLWEQNLSNHLTQKHILLCHHAIHDHSSFVCPQSVTTQSCCSHTPHVVVVTCMCVISTRHVCHLYTSCSTGSSWFCLLPHIRQAARSSRLWIQIPKWHRGHPWWRAATQQAACSRDSNKTFVVVRHHRARGGHQQIHLGQTAR